MSTAGVLSTLSNLVCNTQRFLENSDVQPQPPPYIPFVTPRVCLPDPPSLYHHLIAIGAKEKVANEMNRVYNVRAQELRSHYESSIANAFTAVTRLSCPSHIKDRILDTFTNLYLTAVKSWIEEGVEAYKHSRGSVEQVGSNDELTSTKPRRTFNSDYVPLLERFFDQNQFPTQVDKVFLAKKSGMSYRQIHVWFQNRRNRAKKLNGSCKKRPAREDTTFPLDHLHTRTVKRVVCGIQSAGITFQASSYPNSCRERLSPETIARRTIPPTGDINVLDGYTAPLHAFPSSYPPVCPYEPFSVESRNRVFSERSWPRRPKHETPPSQSPKIDVHDLADQFALLSVKEINPRSPLSDSGMLPGTLAATYSITIIPHPAPHPALIKSGNTVPFLARCPQFPIVRASQPTSLAFAGPTTSSIQNLPRSLSENSSRKCSPFPKRYPRHSPLPCRNTTPPTSDSSSPCPSSRSFSDQSDFEKEMSPLVH